MSDEPDSPTLLTCDRCGAAFDLDTAVAFLGERVVHARPLECVAAFRVRVAALEEENAELRRQLNGLPYPTGPAAVAENTGG